MNIFAIHFGDSLGSGLLMALLLVYGLPTATFVAISSLTNLRHVKKGRTRTCD